MADLGDDFSFDNTVVLTANDGIIKTSHSNDNSVDDIHCSNCKKRISPSMAINTTTTINDNKTSLYCNDCHNQLLALPKRSNRRLTVRKINNVNNKDNSNTNLTHQHSRSLSNSNHLDIHKKNNNSNSNNPNTSVSTNSSSHSRSLSLDDVLNSTLQNDEFLLDNESDIVEEESILNNGNINNNSKPNVYANDNDDYIISINNNKEVTPPSVLLEPSPVNILSSNNSENALLKTPELLKANTQNKSTEKPSNEPLNSPMATIKSVNENDEYLLINKGLALELNKTNNNIAHLMTNDTTDTQTSYTANGSNERNSNNSSHSRSNSNSNNNKLTRSISLKSKKFFTHWGKSRNSSNTSSPSKIPSRNIESSSSNVIEQKLMKSPSIGAHGETHSGWGVSSTSQTNISTTTEPSKTPVFKHSNKSSLQSQKGENVTIVYNSNDIDFENTKHTVFLTPKSSSSGRSGSITGNHDNKSMSTSKVAMFRTPPLEDSNLFKRMPNTISNDMTTSSASSFIKPSLSHGRSSSWQNQSSSSSKSINSGKISKLDRKDILYDNITNDNSIDDDDNLNDDIDFKLRKLKLQLKGMEITKKQLSIEIENLRNERKILISEIGNLKSDKLNLLSSPSKNQEKSFENQFDNFNSNSNAGEMKPKFWKLFGNTNSSTHSNITKHSDNNFLLSPNKLQQANGSMISNTTNTSVSDTSENSSINKIPKMTLIQCCEKDGKDIPNIITKCTKFIENDERFLETEGIYRKSGSIVLIENLEKDLLDNKEINENDVDIHVVTSVLKRFLRNLPDPILSVNIYDLLISLVRKNDLMTKLSLSNYMMNKKNNSDIDYENNMLWDNKLYINIREQLIGILEKLPYEHYEVLRLLICHINKVSEYSKINLMNLHNLALIFAPSLIHDISGERDIYDMKERNYIIEFILLFKVI